MNMVSTPKPMNSRAREFYLELLQATFISLCVVAYEPELFIEYNSI